jgi:hypothetical protein
MLRAQIKNRTNTGLLDIADKSPDNRSKTRRLEGEEGFPLIFFFTRHLANGLLLRNTSSVFALLTARKVHSKRKPDLTPDPIAYPNDRGKECAEQRFRALAFPAMGRLVPLRCVPPCEPLDFKHFAG